MAALGQAVASILDDDELDRDERSRLLAESFAQCQDYLRERLDPTSFEAAVEDLDGQAKRLAKVVEDAFDRTAQGDDAPGNSHHASQVANLLVESGRHPDRTSALDYLLHNKDGQALLARMHKQEKLMDKEQVVKAFKTKRLADLEALGPVAVCKAVVEHGADLAIDEHEFVGLLTKAAQKAHPGLSADRAFAKVFSEQSEQGTLIRKAHAVVKSMPIMADLTPLVVGGEDARNVNDPSAAIAQLQELGRVRWPGATREQQFSRAFADPANRDLAKQAHQRPAPTTTYEFPR
jgi:hypothetical protein